MKFEFYFSPHYKLNITIITEKKKSLQIACLGYLASSYSAKEVEKKIQNIAETEWILAPQNEIEQRGGHLLQMLQEDKDQRVEKAAPRQEQERPQYVQAVSDKAASVECWVLEQPLNGTDKAHQAGLCDPAAVVVDGQVRRFPLLVFSPLYALLFEKSPYNVTALWKIMQPLSPSVWVWTPCHSILKMKFPQVIQSSSHKCTSTRF